VAAHFGGSRWHPQARTGFNSPLFNVLLFSTFWAIQIFVSKLGLTAGVHVVSYQVQSALVALGSLTVFVLPSIKAELVTLFEQQQGVFWRLFLANALHFGLGSGLSIIGIALTEAINAGFLVKLATLTTTLFAWLLLKERMTAFKALTLFVMLSGAYLLTTKAQTLLPRIGDLFILAACVCWSLGNVLIRKILRDQPVSAEAVTFIRPLAGLPVFLVLIWIVQLRPDWLGGLRDVLGWYAFTPSDMLYTLAGGLCLALTWSYLNRTLKIATASYMTMMSMVTPVIVSLLAILFLGEGMLPIQMAGAALIVLSGVATYYSDIAID
jgi:drug/metabolite transporter (DMT)-like permease